MGLLRKADRSEGHQRSNGSPRRGEDRGRPNAKTGGRPYVQPDDLALKLIKEMDSHKVSVADGVSAGNKYTIFLSREDRDHMRGHEEDLVIDLEHELTRHADSKGYEIDGELQVLLVVNSDLEVGEFGILAERSAPGPGQVKKSQPAIGQEPQRPASAPSSEAQAPMSDLPPRTPRGPLAADARPKAPPEPISAALPPKVPSAPVAAEVRSKVASEPFAAAARPIAPSQPLAADVRPKAPPLPHSEAPVRSKAPPPPKAEEPVRRGAKPATDTPASAAAGAIMVRYENRVRIFDRSRIVVGRAKEADLRLNDPSVSRLHAVIYIDNGSVMVEDLNSTNGTLVNGYPVSTTQLGENDMLNIGNCKMTVSAR